MRLWFVPLNVLVAALCIHGIAQEHHPLGRFHSDAKRKGTLPGGLGPGTHHPLCLKAEDVMSFWGGGFMKKVVFQLSLVRLLVWFCCDFAGCFWCSLFVFFVCVFLILYIPVPKASVPAVSCHRFMQGLHGPFPESPVIQLHSWLLHSLTLTHTL